jgi:hypothetical protein
MKVLIYEQIPRETWISAIVAPCQYRSDWRNGVELRVVLMVPYVNLRNVGRSSMRPRGYEASSSVACLVLAFRYYDTTLVMPPANQTA